MGPNSDQLSQRLAACIRGRFDPLLASRVGHVLAHIRILDEAAIRALGGLSRTEFLTHLKEDALKAPVIAKSCPPHVSEALAGAFRVRCRIISGVDLPPGRATAERGFKACGP